MFKRAVAAWGFWQRIPSWGKDVSCLAMVLAVSVFASLPLFKAEIVDRNDSFVAIVKTVGLAMAWQDGHWAGRWLADINFGYGYPLLNFYPPLFSYLSAAMSFLVGNYIIGTNVVLAFGFFFSGVAMYLFARDFWGRRGAVLSSTAYILAPFHLCDIYRRTADAQFLAYVFLPLIAWSFYRLFKDLRLSSFVLAAFSVAGLMLAHNGMAVLFMPIVVAYILFLYFMDPSKALPKLAGSFGAILCAFALTAYYWLPAFLEKQYVMIDKITQGDWDFHVHMMKNLYQLLFAAWTYGHWGAGNGLSFQIGWGHLLLTVLVLAALPFIWRGDRKHVCHVLFWAAVGVFTGFMTLKASTPVWETFAFLIKYVAAPWRLFVFLSFIMSFLAGGIILWQGRRAARWWIVPCAIFFIFSLNHSYARSPGGVVPDLKDPQAFLFKNHPMDNMEFLPKWVRKIPLVPPPNRYEVIQGRAVITRQQRVSGLRHELSIEAQTPAAVCFHHFYFPGWRVLVDGKETEIYADNPYGLILFGVPPGSHSVRIVFGQTPVRVLGSFISGVTVLLLIGFGLMVFVRKRMGVNKKN